MRTEAVATSNEVIKLRASVENANNSGGGCLGMCRETVDYRLVVQKNVPGTDNFADCARLSNWTRNTSLTTGEHIVPLTALCNGNKDQRIQFALIN